MNRTFFSLFIIVLTINVFYGCKHKPTESPDQAKFVINDTFKRMIAIDTVKKQQVENKLTLSGKVSFDENEVVRVFPFVGGQIQSMNVELGDYVKKGQVLAVLRSFETADYANQRIQAEANVDIARKNAEASRSAFNNGLISEKDNLASQNELRKAQAELDKSKSITGLLGEESGKSYVIKAPVSGYIVEKNVNKNMAFRSDNQTNLFTIANLDKVYVIANVFESDINNIREGYDARITTLSYPDKEFTGKIDKIYNVIDPDSKVMKVRIKLNNPGILLKPEMFATVNVVYPENNTMNYVPSSAIIFDKNSYFVMIYRGRDKVETRQVHIYKTFGDITYISDGLKEGEAVISKKALLVYDAVNNG